MQNKQNKKFLIDDSILYRFFEEFGIKPTHKSISIFRKYLKSVAKKEKSVHKVNYFQEILENWLKERYQPDMFATGGTINTLVAEDGSRLPDKSTQENIIKSSGESTRQRVIVYDFVLDSSNQTLETQARLMNKLGDVAFKDIKALESITTHLKKPGKYISIDHIPYYFNFPRPWGPGTVITHGTDTLDENSALSSYMLLPKTLVWTGSWASPHEKGSDAISNIEKAKLLANNSLTPIGVYVVIGDEIHLATKLKKINTHPWFSAEHIPYSSIKPWRRESGALSYFASIDDNPVGYFNKDRMIYFSTAFLEAWEEILTRRSDSYFPLQKVNTLKPAYVEHVYIGKDTPGDVFTNMIKRLTSQEHRCGAIIEGNIAGNPYFEEYLKILNKISPNKEIYILSNSRNKLTLAYRNLSKISAEQLRIKLSALLGREDVTKNNLILLIDDNLTGEILEKDITQTDSWNIPHSFYEKGEFIIAFPGMTRDVIDDAVNSIKKKTIATNEKAILLINGYGDGHIPIGYFSMEERLQAGFEKINPEISRKLINSIKADKDGLFSLQNIIKHLTRITGDSQETDNLLKQVFINSNELLSAIAEALDQGIEVLIGSKAEYAVPDLQAYEIGTILHHVGVKALNIPTKEYFKQFSSR